MYAIRSYYVLEIVNVDAVQAIGFVEIAGRLGQETIGSNANRNSKPIPYLRFDLGFDVRSYVGEAKTIGRKTLEIEDKFVDRFGSNFGSVLGEKLLELMVDDFVFLRVGLHRITSYNVCYTKLLRKLDQEWEY